MLCPTKYIINTRQNIILLMDNLSLEQLNKIPQGFNNNIIWNFAHIVVSQQILCYRLANLPLYISDEICDQFKKGSKPDRKVTQEEIDFFKQLSIDLIHKLNEDFQKGMFISFNEYQTSSGLVLHNIKEAVHYIQTHDALHHGTILVLKKLVNT